MRIFKKLQENSMYWRFRYVTRRQLAMKQWWRERRAGTANARGAGPRYRGMADVTSYNRRMGLVEWRRGAAFVVALAAIWTAISMNMAQYEGFSLGLLRIGLLVVLTYLFIRFW